MTPRKPAAPPEKPKRKPGHHWIGDGCGMPHGRAPEAPQPDSPREHGPQCPTMLEDCPTHGPLAQPDSPKIEFDLTSPPFTPPESEEFAARDYERFNRQAKPDSQPAEPHEVWNAIRRGIVAAIPGPDSQAPGDVLEDALADVERRLPFASGERLGHVRALLALRVLKRGHVRQDTGQPGAKDRCKECRRDWPCPLLAEAARALRGEK